MPSITNTRTVTSSPPKKNLVPRFGRKALRGREVNHTPKVAKAITPEKIKVDDESMTSEHNESMKRWYIDEFNRIRREKVIEFSQSYDHNRRTINVSDIHHQTLWIASKDNTRD
jgi:hypothetical protein